ncbi:MAG: hypothetical protein KDH96_07430 [Candidatus Riesia sp.]|nr:hypothetical protein [Candidatus Riesia sp.]
MHELLVCIRREAAMLSVLRRSWLIAVDYILYLLVVPSLHAVKAYARFHLNWIVPGKDQVIFYMPHGKDGPPYYVVVQKEMFNGYQDDQD